MPPKSVAVVERTLYVHGFEELDHGLAGNSQLLPHATARIKNEPLKAARLLRKDWYGLRDAVFGTVKVLFLQAEDVTV